MKVIAEETTYQIKITQKEIKSLWIICNDYLINHSNSNPKDAISLMAENFYKQFDDIANERNLKY